MRARSKFYMNLLINTIVCLILLNVTIADDKSVNTSARVLAKQTGATQFEEEQYEQIHKNCNDSKKHHLRKRASDEDIDYEVYQGVVGRPGIDFPIYPRIPKTSFSCRSFGNGYFADMETDCQVFHICEEGRKISFLCPNGTIFQQSELTCDWWFKVNCLGSPGYYAESSEILNKQRVQRIRPSVPVQGFNIVGGGSLDYKPKIDTTSTRGRQQQHQQHHTPSQQHTRGPSNKSDRRIDSNEDPAVETIDFDDLSGEKQLKIPKTKIITNIDTNKNDDESQITAESASFVGAPNRRNNFNNNDAERKAIDSRNNVAVTKRPNSSQRRHQNANNNNNNNAETPDRARHGHRGQHRYNKDDEMKKALPESFEYVNSGEHQEPKKIVVLPEKLIKTGGPSDIQSRTNGASNIIAEPAEKPERTDTYSPYGNEKQTSTTSFYPSGTYSTARRLETTRVTPFYTPTVPTVSKLKTTEGKTHYVKGKGSSVGVATTPNPNRFNHGSGLFLESSAAPKLSSTSTAATTPTAITDSPYVSATTVRSIVIGMRHHFETPSDNEKYFPPIAQNTFTSERNEQKPLKKVESREYLPTTTKPATTGPTYLPKSAIAPKTVDDGAGGDALLFAPIPAIEDPITRNVNEMLKAMNLIKDKLEDVEDFRSVARIGLEIPPSSGPDALVSLAQYFAMEQNESTSNALNGLGKGPEKPGKPFAATASATATATTAKTTTTNKITATTTTSAPTVGKESSTTSRLSPTDALKKPSDTISGITAVASPDISSNADDIKASLLSEKIVSKYTDLFGLKEPKAKQANALDDLPKGLGAGNKNETTTRKTPFPQIGSTDATINQLAGKADSRKIAQVFSNALSSYLEDPQSFRQTLQAARPTEPPVGGKSRIDSETTTILPLLFAGGTAASYLPTKSTTVTSTARSTSTSTTTATTSTKSTNIAAEINANFDSTTTPIDYTSTTEVFDTTTYRPTFHLNSKLRFTEDVAPTSFENNEHDEILVGDNTQSLGKARNNLNNVQVQAKNAQKLSDNSRKYHYDVPAQTTENPWNHVSQNDFLDPLTINDGLMKETKTTTTISPFTNANAYAVTTTVAPKANGRGRITVLSGDSQRPQHVGFVGSAEVTTKRYNNYRSQESTDSWSDIFNSYDIPRETLPSSSGLQRIANKLFGGLNETEALHLKNVMAKAEHDRQVLSLLLLLIQTCDDQNGKALERSRKHLLNALIDMDTKIYNAKTTHLPIKTSYTSTTPTSTITAKGAALAEALTTTVGAFSTTTTTRTTTTTTEQSRPPPPQPLVPSTTTVSPPTTTTMGSSLEETTKFEIHVADPDEDILNVVTASPADLYSSETNSDKRALELLKSLYSLASKFTSRR